jgi:hypothetical protein
MSINDFLAALYSALAGNGALMAVLQDVYYDPPGDAPGPYIVIGNGQDLPGRLLDASERQLNQTIYIWSNGKRKELIDIRYLVEDVLDSMAGYEIYLDEVQMMPADDDGWRQVVMDLRVYIR